ncbi:glycerophosphodiester phosphodiesterase [Pontibacter sp. JH31]|uniref:Glycerophosphodiester phosphodiesterase n=1 Tax=Pontibacter aquaedesilientis TaxID=2766980 RepID=A0ABR7XE72_9BACT|nr:glycerophosphodiester phosphodiesterase [Pontibacter aquaedesilientis]MBD1396584.1 glycerophosphodiester phosphodiesterase [Pontibacter aquaedesilientis]
MKSDTKQKSAAVLSLFSFKNAIRLLSGIVIILLAVYGYGLLQPKAGGYSPNILVMGHAGSGFFSPLNPFNPLPSNSMASIVKAMEENGADGVEVDVHVSKDGIPILYHDTRLETMSEGAGMIEALSASKVIGLRYKGGFFYDLFHTENIITLEDMLQLFQQYEDLPYLHIDVRNHDENRNVFYAQSLLALLRRYEYPLEKLAFIFPDATLLNTIREQEPQAVLLLDAGSDFDVSVKEALSHKLHGVAANGKQVTKEQVQRAKEQGLQVVLFGGKSGSSIAHMLDMGPDAIQVNNVKRMRALVDGR